MSAVLVAPRTYEISLRLRGQAGSDALIPAAWPIGSRVVLINSAVTQIDLPVSARGLARHYCIGAAGRGYDDPAVVHRVEAFDGIGLRPYAPGHLAASRSVSGDISLTWVRRTRVDGDSWLAAEVPLGETTEAYLVRVLQNDIILREDTVAQQTWIYSAAQQSADGVAGAAQLQVAQMSDRFGPGLFRSIDIVV